MAGELDDRRRVLQVVALGADLAQAPHWELTRHEPRLQRLELLLGAELRAPLADFGHLRQEGQESIQRIR
jgi:hypothetical protein